MKKILSCVLAIALVFSLMSMTVFAGVEKHPTPNPSDVDAKKYNVVGTQVGENESNTAATGNYTDGITEDNFTGAEVGANVGVSFGETQEVPDGNGGTTTVITGNNIIEHRYAIDILYKELVFDLTTLTPVDQVADPEDAQQTVDRTYKFVWDVNQHTYVMVEVIDGEPGNVVNPDDPANEALTDAAVEIQDAFQVINHSDLSVNYSATISVTNNYQNVLDLSIGTKGTTAVPTTKIDACVANMVDGDSDPNTPPTWEAASQQEGAAHTIIATPDADWATTISALAVAGVAGTAQVTVGSITIIVTK